MSGNPLTSWQWHSTLADSYKCSDQSMKNGGENEKTFKWSRTSRMRSFPNANSPFVDCGTQFAIAPSMILGVRSALVCYRQYRYLVPGTLALRRKWSRRLVCFFLRVATSTWYLVPMYWILSTVVFDYSSTGTRLHVPPGLLGLGYDIVLPVVPGARTVDIHIWHAMIQYLHNSKVGGLLCEVWGNTWY